MARGFFGFGDGRVDAVCTLQDCRKRISHLVRNWRKNEQTDVQSSTKQASFPKDKAREIESTTYQYQ